MDKRFQRPRRPQGSTPPPEGRISHPSADRASASSRGRLALAMVVAVAAVAGAAWQIRVYSGRVRASHATDGTQPAEQSLAGMHEEHAPQAITPPGAAGDSLRVRSKDPAVTPLVQEATAVARRLLEQYPADPAAVAAAARLYRQLGDVDLAVSTWQRCLDLDPGFVYAYVGIGSACVERGEYDKAEAVLRKAQAVAPDSPQVAVLLATVLMNQGKLPETVALLEVRTRDADAPMPCFLLLGQAYLQLKDYAKAKPCFEAVVRMAPDFANAHYGLATTCTRLGRQQEAREHMKRFQEAETSRLARQIEDGKRRDDDAAVRKSVADAHTAAAAICSAHGNASEAERHRREAERLDSTGEQRH
jgi:tetratricopeptide (TPR) repeat protein